MGKWIWIKKEENEINTRGCFAASFCIKKIDEQVKFRICAVTKYMVYINGKQVGRGPIREEKGKRVFDSYDISSELVLGENYLAIRVWNYGLSTYQNIYESPELNFTITINDKIIIESDEKIRCHEDIGHMSHVPKRNVNLGFSDYYDATKFDSRWIKDKNEINNWKYAIICKDKERIEEERSIGYFNYDLKYPKRVECIQDVKKDCTVYSLNLRKAFFQNRRDANETAFSGFVGGIINAKKDMEGVISFPNRAWNGIIGDFKIGKKMYSITDKKRDIPVKLKKGRQLFLLQISGDYDDLYCHIEMSFHEPFQWLTLQGESTFFVIGPTGRFISVLDGKSKICSGLVPFKEMDSYTKEHKSIWENEWDETILQKSYPITYVQQEDVYEDLYLLSLARKEKVVKNYAVQLKDTFILNNNLEYEVFEAPKSGDYKRIILDFGTIYVGELEFCCKAEKGTIIDIYGFENFYKREIDFTTGLNNGIHYVANAGWQKFLGMARIGLRYAMITIRNTNKPVVFKSFAINHEVYGVSNIGNFESSDSLLNRIYTMCRETNLNCTEDSFTDCPTYEQAFWIGDAQLSAMVHNWMFGDYQYVAHIQKLAVSALHNTKLMNALTPTDWNTSIPMWMMNWVISIFETAKISGNEELITKRYPDIKKVLKTYSEFIEEDGAFLIYSWNMLDWAKMDIYDHGVVCGQQAILAYCYKLAANYAKENGMTDDFNYFMLFRDKLINYIDAKMWDEQKQMFLDGWSPEHGYSTTVSIQTHVLLYLYDAIKSVEKRNQTEQYLINIPKEFVKVGSPFMLYFLYESYMKLGKSNYVIEDIKEKWGNMLFYNSTTCWEVFPGFYENSRTRSYCHSWSATPSYFLLKYGLGIKVLADGFKRITFDTFLKELSYCRGSLPTPYGMIYIEWEKRGTDYEVILEVPKQIKVEQNQPNVKYHIRELD